MTMEMTMDDADMDTTAAAESTGLTWLDSVRFGQEAKWEVRYVDPDTQEIDADHVTARSMWLGPGGALVFKVGDYERFAAVYGPGAWTRVTRVPGSTVRAERTLG